MAVVNEAREPTLGIIGGAGVAAAARLYAEVCERVRGATGALPRIALWNLPLSDAIEHAFTAAEPDPEMQALVGRLLAEAFDRLTHAGATVVAMPCNGLHRAAAGEAQRRGVPFIDMIDATIEAAHASGASAAVLIATDATRAGGVYEDRGIEIIAPPDVLHDETAALIAAAIQGPPPGGARMERLVERAARPGACVVVGCTDICGLIGAERAAELHVIESLGCLADRCAEVLGARATAAGAA